MQGGGAGARGPSRGGAKQRGPQRQGERSSNHPDCRVPPMPNRLQGAKRRPFTGCYCMPSLVAMRPRGSGEVVSGTRKPQPKPGPVLAGSRRRRLCLLKLGFAAEESRLVGVVVFLADRPCVGVTDSTAHVSLASRSRFASAGRSPPPCAVKHVIRFALFQNRCGCSAKARLAAVPIVEANRSVPLQVFRGQLTRLG